MAGEDLKIIEDMMRERLARGRARHEEKLAREAAAAADPAIQDLERRCRTELERGAEPVPRYGEIPGEPRHLFFERYRAWCHRNPIAAAERKRQSTIARTWRP